MYCKILLRYISFNLVCLKQMNYINISKNISIYYRINIGLSIIKAENQKIFYASFICDEQIMFSQETKRWKDGTDKVYTGLSRFTILGFARLFGNLRWYVWVKGLEEVHFSVIFIKWIWNVTWFLSLPEFFRILIHKLKIKAWFDTCGAALKFRDELICLSSNPRGFTISKSHFSQNMFASKNQMIMTKCPQYFDNKRFTVTEIKKEGVDNDSQVLE